MKNCREWFFTVNILYHKLCPPLIQATHTHACHSEVSIRFLGRLAFQLPMFRKCDLLPKRDLSDMFVLGIRDSQANWHLNQKEPTLIIHHPACTIIYYLLSIIYYDTPPSLHSSFFFPFLYHCHPNPSTATITSAAPWQQLHPVLLLQPAKKRIEKHQKTTRRGISNHKN